LDTKTAWAKKDGKGFYSLGALWIWISSLDMPIVEYMKKASGKDLLVTLGDRKEIIEYFTG
jgi:hypothetical protein